MIDPNEIKGLCGSARNAECAPFSGRNEPRDQTFEYDVGEVIKLGSGWQRTFPYAASRHS